MTSSRRACRKSLGPETRPIFSSEAKRLCMTSRTGTNQYARCATSGPELKAPSSTGPRAPERVPEDDDAARRDAKRVAQEGVRRLGVEIQPGLRRLALALAVSAIVERRQVQAKCLEPLVML